MSSHKNKHRIIAEKYGLSVKVVEKVCQSQYKFILGRMEAEDRNRIYITGLGKFNFLETVHYHFREKLNAKRNKESNETEQTE
jgi:hypothetical protein